MSAVVFIAAGAVLAAIVFWGVGSGLARLAGIIMVIDGVGGVFIHGGGLANHRYPIEAAVGLGLWLAGHWLFAIKHHQWRSRLGLLAWRMPVLSAIAPIPTR